MFHKLALEAIREGMGSPVWLTDSRIAAVANASIDRSTVDLDRGEMAFKKFKFDKKLDELAASSLSNADKLERLSKLLGEGAFPGYLKRFSVRTAPNLEQSIALHPSSSIEGYKDEPGLDKNAIERRRGFFGRSQMRNNPLAAHHLKIFRNGTGNARLFYKFDGSIQFIKNTR